MEIIEHPPIFHIPGIPDQVFYTWVVMAILVIVGVISTRRLTMVPRGSQNFMEVVLEQFLNELDETVGPDGRRYIPLIATLGLFILVANLMGLVPGLIAPTANLNTTAACALIVFFTYHWIGMRKQGVVNYLKHFAGPVPVALKPLMFIIEIISHCARPLSLSLRLFGNMMAGHILGAIVLGAPATLLIVLFVIGFLFPLKILVALIQTFIFCKLAMLYIAEAVAEPEHH